MRSLIIAALLTLTSFAAFAENSNPVISPDGKRIAFLSDRDGNENIYVMDADGTHVTQLTKTADKKGVPVWSPNGKLLRFFVSQKDLSLIYAIDVKKSQVKEIGRVPGRGVRIASDGKRVLWALGSWTAVQLMESDVDGKNVRQLSDGKSVIWSPRWSPDGKRIAFTGNPTKDDVNIFLMHADGSNVQQLTHFTEHAQSPAWSFDGTRLAIQADTKDRAHIWIVNLADGSAKQLAEHTEAFIDELPAWFPDGKRIAFTSNRSGALEVWAINADGSGLTQLTRESP